VAVAGRTGNNDMLTILLTQTVGIHLGIPMLNVVAFIAGFAMSIGTCVMAAALVSPTIDFESRLD
jgi:hypothetical protein